MTYYFEFPDHEYYALVAVDTNSFTQAAEIYAKYIADDGVLSVLEEGSPVFLTEAEAFMRFMSANDSQNMTVEQATDKFYDTKNGVLLIDSALL
ncbi:hypothetical protein FDG96_gp75 [Bacillus phage Mgbh1]|uniref:Uncharacterized protein n=1 Tax=Bacillus phage Mgbh1 TaxID=1796993 RepID=A0A142F1S7_9CAUD|nr:hypothetical protein FDG96_gp75 [Bacillus phage Mgbh1]AMQ66734.1 hypothetical protein [Bacillus phage Mgbh1]